MESKKELRIVDSKVHSLAEIFSASYTVDFYQREYVWQKKQIEDLISDLTIEFLKNWKPEHDTTVTGEYDPYYMGEVVLSVKPGNVNSVIDGQQRITTFTLLLMYIIKKFESTPDFPKSDMERLVYKNERGAWKFTLGIDERNKCMKALYDSGSYSPPDGESMSVSIKNLVDRYNDMGECWDDRINETNINCFAYWLMGNVMFSKVWTNSDEFAYVIFETMNDRGLSLTQIEMLRSYLLANIKEDERQNTMNLYDQVISELASVKLSSKSKAEFEFFKIFFRGHYADNLSQSADSNSDFIVIGQQFHRWVRDKSKNLGLNTSDDYVDFINKIAFFARKYIYIMKKIENRKESVIDYLYLIINNDYGFTLQPALLLSAISYNDTEAVVNEKIKIVSKYLTKVLSWRVWRHTSISQSSMEDKIYKLCKQLRGKTIDEIKSILATEPIEIPELSTPPTLNMMNKPKIRVLLSLITEIVARESNESDYMLNYDNIEVEHIWADHYEWFSDVFPNESDFNTYRNNIGDLLVLPKSFNASYGDMEYEDKVELYFSQNILAQSLCKKKYTNSPGFMAFLERSGLNIHSYEHYSRDSIAERAELYRQILLWNWK